MSQRRADRPMLSANAALAALMLLCFYALLWISFMHKIIKRRPGSEFWSYCTGIFLLWCDARCSMLGSGPRQIRSSLINDHQVCTNEIKFFPGICGFCWALFQRVSSNQDRSIYILNEAEVCNFPSARRRSGEGEEWSEQMFTWCHSIAEKTNHWWRWCLHYTTCILVRDTNGEPCDRQCISCYSTR